MRKKILEIENLSFRYPDGITVLEGISFSVDEGETLAIIGPNGAGKSTLLLHFNGVLRGSGEVRIFGKKISRENLKKIRSRVGLVFQDPNDQLFMATVFDDVAFGPLNLDWQGDEVESRVNSILKELGLEAYMERHPHHLSAGEKKKVSLATVLVMKPELLVLDEPTSGLDPGARRNFISLLKNTGRTKILATHDLDLVWELGTRVILINRGKVVAEGLPEEILSDLKLLEENSLEVPLSLLLEKKTGPGNKALPI